MGEALTANTTRTATIARSAKTRATLRRYANTGSANTPATSAARPGANTLTSSSIARSAANYARMASERRYAHSVEEAVFVSTANARSDAHSAEAVVCVAMANARTSAANAKKKACRISLTGIAGISGDTPRPGAGRADFRI